MSTNNNMSFSSINELPNLGNEEDMKMQNLSVQLTELQRANKEILEARRAALNLMEDAIASKEALRINEERIRRQKEAFQAAINGAPLYESLNMVASIITEETQARTAFYRVDENNAYLHPIFGAGTMPETYLQKIDGFIIGEDSLACGLAIPTGQPVITADILEEPLWKQWAYLAKEFSFRGCWSFPIKTRDNKAIGTFAMYFNEPRKASRDDIELAGIVTQTAAVILSNYMEEQKRARAEEALHDSEARNRAMVSQSSVGIFGADLLGTITFLNEKARELFGYGKSEGIGVNILDITVAEFRDDTLKKFQQLINNEQPFVSEKRITRKDGTEFWANVSVAGIKTGKNKIRSIVGIVVDITHRKAAEEALRVLNETLEQLVQKRTRELTKLKVNQEKERLNAIVFTQEQERARISEALHDGVAQLLYAAQNMLQSTTADEAGNKELQIASDILGDAIKETRKVSFELMPPMLRDYGLETCLKVLSDRIFGGKLYLAYDIRIAGRLPEKLEITIYRIVQETLNNILKHARATEASVMISASEKYVHLKVVDNGIGFLVKPSVAYHSVGLQSIRNRVKLLDGKIKIVSALGKGTAIELQLPLSDKE